MKLTIVAIVISLLVSIFIVMYGALIDYVTP